MKETLVIRTGFEGAIWRYRYAGQVRSPHRHDELEVNLVTGGTASYLIRNVRYDLQRNTQIWFFPAQDHVLFNASPDFSMWIGVFRPALIERACNSEATRMLLQPDPPGQFCRRVSANRAEWLNILFDEVSRDYDADAERCNAGLAYALLAAWQAHRDASNVRGNDVHPAVEAAAHALRHEDVHQPVSLADLARQCGLSPSHLSRLFQRQTGMSLVAFRNRQRLERFLRAYGDGQRDDILSAALAAGFGSYAQFHRVFTQTMCCSPADYRRQLRV